MIKNGKWVGKVTTYQDYHGALEGKVVTNHTIEISLADRKITSKVEGIFTGTVNGKQGSFIAKEVDCYGPTFTPDSGMMTCRFTIVSGTGELSGLRGDINTRSTFGPTSFGSEYWGTLSFEK